MHGSELRVLNVAPNDLTAATAKNLAKMFREISEDRDRALSVRGKFVLGLPDFDSDRRPNYAIPEIRQFVAALDRACPFATYFICGDPALNHIQFYLLCLVPIHASGTQYGYSLQDLLAVAIERTTHIAQLAQRLGDDVDRATDGVITNMPPEALCTDPRLARRVLQSLKPTLEALKRDWLKVMWRPGGRTLARETLKRAAILAGLPPVDNPDRALIDQLLRLL